MRCAWTTSTAKAEALGPAGFFRFLGSSTIAPSGATITRATAQANSEVLGVVVPCRLDEIELRTAERGAQLGDQLHRSNE